MLIGRCVPAQGYVFVGGEVCFVGLVAIPLVFEIPLHEPVPFLGKPDSNLSLGESHFIMLQLATIGKEKDGLRNFP